MPSFIFSGHGLLHDLTNHPIHRIDFADNMAARWLPTCAIARSGRQFTFNHLQDAASELYISRIWNVREYVAVNLWLRSYQAGGALPGDILFASPRGWMVKFPQLLDEMIDWYEWFLASGQFEDPVEEADVLMAERIDNALDAEIENLEFDVDPEEFELSLQALLDMFNE